MIKKGTIVVRTMETAFEKNLPIQKVGAIWKVTRDSFTSRCAYYNDHTNTVKFRLATKQEIQYFNLGYYGDPESLDCNINNTKIPKGAWRYATEEKKGNFELGLYGDPANINNLNKKQFKDEKIGINESNCGLSRKRAVRIPMSTGQIAIGSKPIGNSERVKIQRAEIKEFTILQRKSSNKCYS